MISALYVQYVSSSVESERAYSPTKSKVCLNCWKVSFRVGLSLSVKNRQAKAIPPVGRLMSDISFAISGIGCLTEDPSPGKVSVYTVIAWEVVTYQDTRSVRSPPKIGPATDAIPQIPPMNPCQYPRDLRGVISAVW